MTDPETRPCKIADESEVIVQACSVITVACSLGAAGLLIKNKRKQSTWVKKYICGRQQYGECNTLLPELAATEVVKCDNNSVGLSFLNSTIRT